MSARTFYDDAEFAAINATRLAIAEDGGDPKSAAIHDVTMDMFERHGSTGVSALVVILARNFSTALSVVGHQQGKTPDAVLDDFEQHKLEQVTDDDA